MSHKTKQKKIAAGELRFLNDCSDFTIHSLKGFRVRRAAAFTRREINLSKRECALMSKLHESEIHRAAAHACATCYRSEYQRAGNHYKGNKSPAYRRIINCWRKEKLFQAAVVLISAEEILRIVYKTEERHANGGKNNGWTTINMNW